MTECRTVSGLLDNINRNRKAKLHVYSNNGTPIWANRSGVVTLNLGGGNFSQISENTYRKIKNDLVVIKC